MSIYGLPAELPSGTRTDSAIAVEARPEQAEGVDPSAIIARIAESKKFLYSPPDGEKIKPEDVYASVLPVSPLSREQVSGPDGRQRTARADLEAYKEAVADPALKDVLGELWIIDFKGFSWDRPAGTPVYTEMAYLNPNFAVLVNFDLDAAGYAVESSAKLLMSRDQEALHEMITKDIGFV
jgi:hypothetical protein